MTIQEVYVKRKPEHGDPRGADVSVEAVRTLGIHTKVTTTSVYRLEGVSESQIQNLATKAFIDPIIEEGTINPEQSQILAYPSVEVSYRRGVTDPVAGTIQKVGADMSIPIEAAQVSTKYEFEGISQAVANHITDRLLVNKTVQEVITEKPESLKVTGEKGVVAEVPIVDATDEDLLALSKDKLFLNLEEMKVIQKYFRELERDPSDAELEIIAARWSEHCVHKTFNAVVVVEIGRAHV